MAPTREEIIDSACYRATELKRHISIMIDADPVIEEWADLGYVVTARVLIPYSRIVTKEQEESWNVLCSR